MVSCACLLGLIPRAASGSAMVDTCGVAVKHAGDSGRGITCWRSKTLVDQMSRIAGDRSAPDCSQAALRGSKWLRTARWQGQPMPRHPYIPAGRWEAVASLPWLPACVASTWISAKRVFPGLACTLLGSASLAPSKLTWALLAWSPIGGVAAPAAGQGSRIGACGVHGVQEAWLLPWAAQLGACVAVRPG